MKKRKEGWNFFMLDSIWYNVYGIKYTLGIYFSDKKREMYFIRVE